ncbi:substrate-binding periplasmic protein [Marinobacter halotolerans]|uniref:substrate-binding periplasmic protein n=1 Tax=Marinobacter halotolerans TaxID=1569211 RepID=UPI0012487E3B|nr:transporter substrate-binding domain-containing protein [Marinobacter halotolerans]
MLVIKTLSVLRRIRYLALFVCLAFAPVAVASDEVVTFAIPDVWPWAYEDDKGVPRGSLVEIVHRLSELADVPVSFRLRPLRRALVELEAGAVNFSLLFESPVLDARAVNVGQVLQISIMLAAPVNTNYPLTLEALEGQRIGYIRGTYLGEAFRKDTGVNKVPVALITQAVEMLSLGRLSAVLASDHAILKALHAMDLSPGVLRYRNHVPGQRGALYMSRESSRPEVAEKFRQAIVTMKKNNELERIFFGEGGRRQLDGSASTAPRAAQ